MTDATSTNTSAAGDARAACVGSGFNGGKGWWLVRSAWRSWLNGERPKRLHHLPRNRKIIHKFLKLFKNNFFMDFPKVPGLHLAYRVHDVAYKLTILLTYN